MGIWIALAQAGMQLAQGQAAAEQAKAEGAVAGDQALADESSFRRQARSLRGENAAALAQSGLTPDGSSGMLADQSAAEAELDALNIRYQGQVRRLGLNTEARQARSGSQMLAGGRLLSGVADAYTNRRKMPGTGLIAQQTAAPGGG